MKVKFKKLHEDAVLPLYAKTGDAGLDLTATDDGKFVESDESGDLFYYIEYSTGLAAELPEGHVGLIFPRSSISNTALILSNAVGVLDQNYRGEIKARFKLDAGVIMESDSLQKQAAKYKKGDRIAQLIIVPYPTVEPEFVDELSSTDRGSGGFGSTGV